MHEVWPNEANFGNEYYPLIKVHLVLILTSKTEAGWTNVYQSARKLIDNHPLKVEKLEAMYSNPSYCTGYYLRGISYNLRLQGSVPTEINHLSIVRHFGPSASRIISYHIVKILEIQQNHHNKICPMEDDANIMN